MLYYTLMEPNRHYVIYGLVDPETSELRYVGKSSIGLKRGHQKHSAHCENWRKSLRARNLKPKVIVIEDLTSYGESLNEREKHWIAYHRSQGASLTNLTVGGDGYVLSPEHRAKLLAANTGRICSSETRLKISLANIGKKRTPEQCQRSGDAHRGLKASDETRTKMSRTRKGVPKSEKHIAAIIATKEAWSPEFAAQIGEKIAASKRDVPRDEETRRKISEKLKGKPWSEARRAASRCN